MKPKEFYKIMYDFVEEDKYWRALQVGDTIYDVQARGGEVDYHEMKIDNINLEERYVVAHDVEGDHIATLNYFLTQAEFDKMFNSLIKN
jgi:hypothetical protein